MKVNEKKRGRPDKYQDSLSKEVIITAAKCLMENNKSIPSVRALARDLNVDTMAIYYYFKNKDQLLEAITTSLIIDLYHPGADKNWQDELRLLCKSYLSTLAKYDGLLTTLLSMQSESPAMVFVGRFKQITKILALDAETETPFLNLLVDYIHGFSLAMSCDSSSTLTIDDIDPQMTLIFKAVV